MVSNSLLFFLLWQLPSFASIPSSYRSATHFYRNMKSTYSSGQASREFLSENQIGYQMEFSYQGQWDHRDFLIPGESILRDIQLTESLYTSRSTKIFARRDPSSLILSVLPAGKKLKAISVIDSWALVYFSETNFMGYVTLSDLTSHWGDTGFFTNFIETSIRKEANHSSLAIKQLPRLSRIKPLEINAGWIRFKYDNQVVFADAGHFLGRVDFAKKVYLDGIGWTSIKGKNFDKIIISNNREYPLLSIKGFVTDNNLGIVIDRLKEGYPSQRSHFKIDDMKSRLWAISRIPKHGEVFWIQKDFSEKDLSQKNKPTDPSDKILSTQDLLARGLTSISFSPLEKKEFHALASAQGIYKSVDGQNWQQIKDFTHSNYPVSIHPNGAWFVGPYISQNQGDSFEPFIKWDNLAKLLKAKPTQQLSPIKIKEIKALSNSQVQFHLEVGSSRQILLKSAIQK